MEANREDHWAYQEKRKTATKRRIRLIHHGSDCFDKHRFTSVQNAHASFGHILGKPLGGLWTSPVESTWGWRDWCRSEEFEIPTLDKHFELEFYGKAYVIDSLEDLLRAPIINNPIKDEMLPVSMRHFDCAYLDFEKMIKDGWDAVHLTEKGESATRFSDPFSMYGWDCETVFVMTEQSITPVEK